MSQILKRNSPAFGYVTLALIGTLMVGSVVQAQESASGTSTVTLPQEESKRSPFGLSYFNFASADKTSIDKNTTKSAWFFDQYITGSYRLNKDERVAARLRFFTQVAGLDGDRSRDASTKPGDFSMTYNNYNMWRSEDWGLTGTFYSYFPTSESSQQKEWLLRLKTWLILENKLSRNWTFTYNMEPEIFLNRRNEYSVNSVDSRGRTRTEWRNSRIGVYEHYVRMSYYINSWFEPQVSAGFEHSWNQTSPLTTRGPSYEEAMKLSLGTWVRFHRNFKIIAQVENMIETKNRPESQPYGIFRADDMAYQVLVFGTIL